MNRKANWLMILSAFSFLFCSVLGARRCFVCYHVNPDNSCAHEMLTCEPGMAEKCYTRRYNIGERVTQIQRGCTFVCYTRVDIFHYMKAETLCCGTSLCNTHDIWPENKRHQ